jgi:hypothetical protein
LRRRVLIQGRNRHAFDHREVHLGRMCTIDDPISMRVACLLARARHLLQGEFDCRRPHCDSEAFVTALMLAEQPMHALVFLVRRVPSQLTVDGAS